MLTGHGALKKNGHVALTWPFVFRQYDAVQAARGNLPASTAVMTMIMTCMALHAAVFCAAIGFMPAFSYLDRRRTIITRQRMVAQGLCLRHGACGQDGKCSE
jgi:hypothetical protein